MTPAGRTLAIWGGGSCLLAVVGLAVLGWRGSTASALHAHADQLYASYEKYYHPHDPKDGEDIKDAETDLKASTNQQLAQLDQAEADLVPALPPNYLSTNINEDDSLARTDHMLIKNSAMSRGVVISGKLPLDHLDNDERIRAVQMAELYLYRVVLEQCIAAKVLNVTRIQLGKTGFDPTRTYQTFVCDFEVDTSFEAGQHLLDELSRSTAHLGIWLCKLKLTPSPTSEDRQVMHFSAMLVTHVLPLAAAATGHAPGER